MPAVRKRIRKLHPVLVGNSLGQGQSQPGGPLFLCALIESVENPLPIQRRLSAVFDGQSVSVQCYRDNAVLRAVHKCVLDEIRYQNRGKRLVHPDYDRRIRHFQ